MTLPDTLLRLKDGAVCWNENLTAMTLPDSLIAIEERNLYACPKRTDVTIPAGIRFIGDASFSSVRFCEKSSLRAFAPSWTATALLIGPKTPSSVCRMISRRSI